MEKINFTNNQAPYIDADNLNLMQTNIETTISEVVESGENEKGSWTKWADGTMICTNRIYDSSDTTIEGGNLYLSPIDVFPDYPIPFVGELPTVTITYQTADWASGFGLYVQHIETGVGLTKAGSYRLVSGNSSTNNGGYINYIAKGKWK